MCVAEVDPSSGKITIYSLPDCMACKATARVLEKAGILFEVVDLSGAPEALEAFKAQGLMQAPVVQTPDGQQWSGFRPDRIKGIQNPPQQGPQQGGR